jgi:hypothetical protein
MELAMFASSATVAELLRAWSKKKEAAATGPEASDRREGEKASQGGGSPRFFPLAEFREIGGLVDEEMRGAVFLPKKQQEVADFRDIKSFGKPWADRGDEARELLAAARAGGQLSAGDWARYCERRTDLRVGAVSRASPPTCRWATGRI